MKYIKEFEASQKQLDKKFWIIQRTRPYLDLSLEKLGVTPSTIDLIIDTVEMMPFSYGKLMYICCFSYYNSNGVKKTAWTQQPYKTAHKRTLITDNYVYMGQVEITSDDLENWKMKDDMTKYNL